MAKPRKGHALRGGATSGSPGLALGPVLMLVLDRAALHNPSDGFPMPGIKRRGSIFGHSLERVLPWPKMLRMLVLWLEPESLPIAVEIPG